MLMCATSIPCTCLIPDMESPSWSCVKFDECSLNNLDDVGISLKYEWSSGSKGKWSSPLTTYILLYLPNKSERNQYFRSMLSFFKVNSEKKYIYLYIADLVGSFLPPGKLRFSEGIVFSLFSFVCCWVFFIYNTTVFDKKYSRYLNQTFRHNL